jgi:hypothetical protein
MEAGTLDAPAGGGPDAREQQLAWERKWAPIAAGAAILSIVVSFVGIVFQTSSFGEAPDNDVERMTQLDAESSDFILASVINGIAVLLVIVPLYYLYRATKARRENLPTAAIVLGVLGPIVSAIVGVLFQLDRIDAADEFLALPDAQRTEERADDLLSEGIGTLVGFGYGSSLATGFAFLMINLNAMRAGLLSRFMGVLGIIIGVLFALPIIGGPQLIQIFWLGAMAALFIGKWPGGRGPAWETGRPEPWPSAAEQRARMEARAAGQPEPAEPEAADPDTPQNRPRKRKRKRR